MNRVILMGRLSKDPEIRWSQGNPSTCIARFTLAVDERRANADGSRDTNWIRCVAFGKTAEFAEKYTHQGTKLVAEGRWKTGSYQNQSGTTVYTNECYVDSLEFAESKNAQGQNYGNSGQAYSQNGQNAGGGYRGPQTATGPQQNPQGYQQMNMPLYPTEQAQARGGNAIGNGFIHIPDDVDDDGLPFN